MEFLLRICTRRNLAIATISIGFLYCAARLQSYPRQWYRHWRYAPQQGLTAGGKEILELKEKKDSARLLRHHERILALLAQARTEGFQVDALERKAAVALNLNDERHRPQAVKILTEVGMSIPQKKAQYVPSQPDDDETPVPPPARHRRAKKRS